MNRISNLNTLALCPGLSELQMESDNSKAADTGSMAGRIVELAHKSDPLTATKQANLELATSYPLADALAATRAAKRHGLDPDAEVSRREFAALPVLTQTKLRLA